jgi:uridylate kinase
MKYKRILLKLSGEALMGATQGGIDPGRLDDYARQIKEVVDMKIQVAIVIGGGNIFRGLKGTQTGIDRVTGDYMGMLATVINGLAIQSALRDAGVTARILSGLPVKPVAEPVSGPKAIEYLERGDVVILTGGTGNPYFTTDTAAALRAVEIKADVLLKGTRVDGVYNTDPEKDPSAIKFDRLSSREAYEKGLKIMDLTAFTLCSENKLPIVIFNMNKEGNLKKAVNGENTGTIVTFD